MIKVIVFKGSSGNPVDGRSYAEAVRIVDSHLTERQRLARLPLCEYHMISGACPDRRCRAVHGELCDACNKFIIHPYNQEMNKEHRENCLKQQQQVNTLMTSSVGMWSTHRSQGIMMTQNFLSSQNNFPFRSTQIWRLPSRDQHRFPAESVWRQFSRRSLLRLEGLASSSLVLTFSVSNVSGNGGRWRTLTRR